MSGHWRFCVAAFLLFAALSTSPALSNPLTDLLNPAPKEAPAPASDAPAPAKEECFAQPGRSTAPSRHWVYHLDGHRKCWFQADATVSAKKQVRHHAVKQPVIAAEENEAGLRNKTVADARAQLLSTAPADAPQPTPPAPEVVDTASMPANGATTLVPAAPIVVAEPAIDQPTPEHATPGPLDAEMLLAAAPPARDPVAATVASSAPPATLAAPSVPDADVDQWELMARRAGMVLIVLGLVFLIGSALASQFLGPRAAPIRRA
jgi:hypothetical protein